MRLHFVRGHCGWDVVTLLLGREVPSAMQLEVALQVLDAPVNGGIEAGILERTGDPAAIRLRVTDGLTRGWLPMCGGMSQVIGKALVETSLREHFGIDCTAPMVRVRLQTDSCEVPLAIEVADNKAVSVTTTMDSYAGHLYELGIEPVMFTQVAGLRVGEFLVVDVADLETAYPGVDFTRRDPGAHLDIVNSMLESFARHLGGVQGVVSMLYDDRPEGSGDFRAFPRFHGADDTAARIPYEFQCGTGTVAVAVALAHARRLPFGGPHGSFVLEWGSQRATPDPFGIRTSKVDLELSDDRIVRIDFQHSVIEIVAEGTLLVPSAI